MKTRRKPLTKLQKAAKGRECMVRIPSVCNGNETTVLAHINRGGVGGMGMKPPDVCGVWACSSCHDEADRRTTRVPTQELDTYLLEALCRTLSESWKNGLIKTL